MHAKQVKVYEKLLEVIGERKAPILGTGIQSTLH